MPFKRRRVYVKKRKTMAEKKMAKVVRKELKDRGILRPELKYYTEFANTAVLQDDLIWANHSNFLNPIAQGDAHNQRDGFDIQPIKLEIKIQLQQFSNNVGIARILVIRWEDEDEPILGHIFEDPTSTGLLINCLYNPFWKNSYKILFDKSYPLAGTFNNNTGSIPVDLSINLKNHGLVKYTDNSGTVANVHQGRYYLVYMSDRASAQGPIMNFTNRFYYTDN